ncbi:hypothetical protein JNJ66_03555 [Candidatus Saccharibacteria bacterium]|nr:hypothetical protein [Candidatus Saccharibacteria bacterium]
MNDRLFAAVLGTFFVGIGGLFAATALTDLQIPYVLRAGAIICDATAICADADIILLPVAAILMLEGAIIAMVRAVSPAHQP